MKSRFGRTLLTLLLVAFFATPLLAQQGLTCGQTGFEHNIGSTLKSFRCAPVPTTAGTGTLTFNATSTVVGTAGAFSGFAAPTAVPGADGVFFRPVGLYVVFGGEFFFLNVTAKASNTSITALLGTGAVPFSGTTTRWGYWQTDCYRTAAAETSGIADSVTNLDARLWASPPSIRAAIPSAITPGGNSATMFVYFGTASSAVSSTFYARPQGMATTIFAGPSGNATITSGSPISSAARSLSVFSANTSSAIFLPGREFQFSTQSASASTTATFCIYSSK